VIFLFFRQYLWVPDLLATAVSNIDSYPRKYSIMKINFFYCHVDDKTT
jgi:hypothetical protein